MKENSLKLLRRLKRNFIEREGELVSQGLTSTVPAIVTAALIELRKLKDPFHMHNAVELLKSPNDEIVIASLKYLEKVEHPVPYEKLAFLMKKGTKVKKAVASAAKLCDYRSACELLKTLLKDPSHDVKISALKACGEIGCDDEVEYIKELAKGDNMDLKLEAIETLIELGEEVTEDELKKIIFNPLLNDKERKKALKLFLKYSISPLEIIKKVLNMNHLPLTLVALKSLGKMKCGEVWEIIENFLKDEQSPTIMEPVLDSALRSCANEKSELEKLALKHLDHPSKKVKVLAFKILMQVNVAQAKDLVEDFLNSDIFELKKAAIPFVYNYPTQENIEILKKIIKEGEERNAALALKTLRKLKIYVEEAREYMEENHSLNVKKEALKTLISSKQVEANELETIALSDEPLQLRIIALEGIAKIEPEKLNEMEVTS